MSVIVFFLIFSMLAVMWLDITSYTIPNWLVSVLLMTYPVGVYSAHAAIDWKMALVGAAIVLAIGFIIFARKIMGGGDIKLMMACALWVGWQNLLDFLLIVSFLGGAFAVIIWFTRKAMPLLRKKQDMPHLTRLLREGEPVPYGVAIAIGFLIMIGSGEIPVLS